jgi:PDZ domain/Aspartyl protease
MIRVLLRLVLSVWPLLACGAAFAQDAEPNAAPNAASALPDPNQILAAVKAASGGRAWDALRTQHSNVKVDSAGFSGVAERWSDIASGRSYIKYSIGPLDGAAGYDGKLAWSLDSTGQAHVDTANTARELAVNAAYRDQLAFWYPERARAVIAYAERVSADGAEFDVIRITPEGGRPFDLWVNTETHLIERLVEREAQQTRTEYYMDLRDVQGVKIPFRVRATRGDPRDDEVVVVDRLEYNAPLTNVSFAVPDPAKSDFTFPAGAAAVEVPLEMHGGHLFLPVMINGQGPLRMLLDASAANVMLPGTAETLGLKLEIATGGIIASDGKQEAGMTRVDRLEVGGIVLAKQIFTAVDIASSLQRTEGLDNVAGVLGYELFRRFPVRIDYQRLRATFYDPAQFKYTGNGQSVSFKLRDRMPLVEGSIDGVQGLFAVDTGSGVALALLPSFVAGNNLVARLRATPQVVTGAGIDARAHALLARADVLRLGPVDIAKPVVTLSTDDTANGAASDLAGNLGFGILRQFNITFDYQGSMLYLEKNANFGQPDTYDRSGMWVERTANGYEIVDVVQGGPAARAGLTVGSVIVAINGKPWSSLSLDAMRATLRATPGTKVRLKLGSGKEHVLTLRELI